MLTEIVLGAAKSLARLYATARMVEKAGLDLSLQRKQALRNQLNEALYAAYEALLTLYIAGLPLFPGAENSRLRKVLDQARENLGVLLGEETLEGYREFVEALRLNGLL